MIATQRLFLFFSHQLTAEQETDAYHSLKIKEIIALPENLQNLWSDVPPDLDEEQLDDYLQPFIDYLKSMELNHTDVLLVQGDFGATFTIINLAQSLFSATCVYATTERQHIEQQNPDGSVTIHKIFRHKRFRKYFNLAKNTLKNS